MPPKKKARTSDVDPVDVKRPRNWVFTFHEPPADWIPERLVGPAHGIRFIAGQYERCATSGRVHFQGYVCFSGPVGLAAAKQRLQAPTAHLEPRRGTHRQALDYVQKDETRMPERDRVYAGEPPHQGERTDLVRVREAIDNGATFRDLVLDPEHFATSIKYLRGLERWFRIRDDAPRDIHDPPRVYYIWGDAGAGKTRAVFEHFPSIFSAPIAQKNACWFDGYEPSLHDTLLLDDFRGNYHFSFLLKMLDRYPLQLPVKGAFVNARYRYVIITSNIPLDAQYPDITSKDLDALWRRFHMVVYVSDSMSVPVWLLCSRNRPLGTVPDGIRDLRYASSFSGTRLADVTI